MTMAKIRRIGEQFDAGQENERQILRNEIKNKVNEKLLELESDPDFMESLKKTGPFGWVYGKRDQEGIGFDINIGAIYKIK